MSFRSILADKIRKLAPDGVTVYEDGQDVVATPCIVVRPSDPYLVPTTMTGDPTKQRVQVFMDVWVVSNMGEITAALNELEELRKVVTAGVMDTATAPVGRWTQFGGFGAVTIAGTQYASAVVQSVLVSDDVPVT